jgi:hypothetical protein
MKQKSDKIIFVTFLFLARTRLSCFSVGQIPHIQLQLIKNRKHYSTVQRRLGKFDLYFDTFLIDLDSVTRIMFGSDITVGC